MHATPGVPSARPRRRGLVRQVLAFVAGLGVATGALVLSTPVASATAAAKTHDPQGVVTSAKVVNGALQLTGWAYDPDARANDVHVWAELDGARSLGSTQTSVANAAVTKKYGLGPTPGYTLTVTPPSGKHTVCVIATNQNAGTNGPVGCVSLPLGTALSSAQLAARLPAGDVTSATATSGALTVSGYATDPDYRNAHLRAVLYVDGTSVDTEYTGGRPVPAVTSAGGNSAFTLTAPVATGTHVACVWIVNIGLGTGNTPLGCSVLDTRGTNTSTAPVTQPALNKAVMTEALKHRGASYVWAAAGPKSFDCSGLVVYAYNPASSETKTGTAAAKNRPTLNLPHQSEQQAVIARLIPASRAVPGDLVFYYDNVGDVYHVGLYTKPGQDFAAIDEQEGVDYQTIWDPTSVFYGSVTHT